MGITRNVKYEAEYHYWSCYDDGGLGHDISSNKATTTLKSTNDKDARIEAQNADREYQKRGKSCHDQPGPPYVVKVIKTVHEKTDDGFERTTKIDLSLPTIKRCPCGKSYVPLRGEKACHELREV